MTTNILVTGAVSTGMVVVAVAQAVQGAVPFDGTTLTAWGVIGGGFIFMLNYLTSTMSKKLDEGNGKLDKIIEILAGMRGKDLED